VLVLGAGGTLGHPVARSLVERGHAVQVLVRNGETALRMFNDTVTIVEGDATNQDHVRRAMAGCDAVHVSLPSESELVAVQHVIDLAADGELERVSYISGTSVREDNRWFPTVEVKLRAEESLRHSGLPHVVFRPTWVMEALHRFVQGDRAAVIEGTNAPALHFFCAADLGRMVATAYEDDRVLGKCLYVHGPEGITLSDALHSFLKACHPDLSVAHLELWQARLIASITGRMDTVSRLIGFFDHAGESGDPTEANALLGAPSTTLADWIESQRTARPTSSCSSRPSSSSRSCRPPTSPR